MGIFFKILKQALREAQLFYKVLSIALQVELLLTGEDLIAIEEAFYACDFGPDTHRRCAERSKSWLRVAPNQSRGRWGRQCLPVSVLGEILSGSEGKHSRVTRVKSPPGYMF